MPNITFHEVELIVIIPTGTMRRKAVSDRPKLFNEAVADNDYVNMYMFILYFVSAWPI